MFTISDQKLPNKSVLLIIYITSEIKMSVYDWNGLADEGVSPNQVKALYSIIKPLTHVLH